MKLGSKKLFLIIFFFLMFSINADEKITTTPLINLENIKPSFEEPNEKKENLTDRKQIKEKKKQKFLTNLLTQY